METTNSFPSPRADFVSSPAYRSPSHSPLPAFRGFHGDAAHDQTPQLDLAVVSGSRWWLFYTSGSLLVMSQCPNFSSGKKKSVVRTLTITWVSAVRLQGWKVVLQVHLGETLHCTSHASVSSVWGLREARGFCFCVPPTTSLDLTVVSGLFWSHPQCFYTMRGVVLAPLGCWIMDQSTLCCLCWHPRRSSSVVAPKRPSLLALAKVSMIAPWKTPRMHRQGDAGYVRVADDIKLLVITQQVAWLITWPVLLSGEETLDPPRLKEPVILPQTCCAHLGEAYIYPESVSPTSGAAINHVREPRSFLFFPFFSPFHL